MVCGRCSSVGAGTTLSAASSFTDRRSGLGVGQIFPDTRRERTMRPWPISDCHADQTPGCTASAGITGNRALLAGCA